MSMIGTVDLEVAVHRVGLRSSSKSDSVEHLLDRQKVGVGGDVRVVAEHLLAP